MDQFEEVISAIQKDEDYPGQTDLLQALITNEGAPLKPEIKLLLETLSKIVTSPTHQPRTKFYAIMITKEFTVRKFIAFISSLSSSQLLQDMLKLAREVDPKKKMAAKGLNLFPTDKDLGNKYITLILQCIVKWSEKHPKTSSKADTKFRIGYNDLVERGVVLPKEFVYFMTDALKQLQSQDRPPSGTPTGNPRDSSSPVNQKSAESTIKHSISKVQGFFTFLDNCEDEDDLIREIKRYHKLFQDDMVKMQTNSNQYLQTLNEMWMGVYFDINEFYTTEGNTYKRALQISNDVNLYIEGLYPALEVISKHFTKIMNPNKPEPKIEPPKKQPSRIADSDKKASKDLSKISQKPEPPSKLPQNLQKIPKPDIDSQPPQKIPSQLRKMQSDDPQKIIRETEKQKQNERRQRQLQNQEREKRLQQQNIRRRSKIEQENMDKALHQLEKDAVQGEAHIKQFLSVSAANNLGFGSIRYQIEREKGAISQHQSRQEHKASKSKNKYRSVTPVSHYRSKSTNQQNFNQSLSQSKVSVFQLFPDMIMTKSDYSGSIVPMRLTYARQLLEMSEAQGIKRFKASNFKQKSLLLEDELIQVGFKSTAHYEKLQSFKAFLKITMFFGNKTDYPMTHLETEFQGNKTILLYSNPNKIESTVEPGFQAKQELLVIPFDIPFNLINLRLKFMLNRELTKVNLFLPTTLLKFVIFHKMDLQSFKARYKSLKRTAMRTIPFKLSRNLPPNTLKRYLNELVEMNDYQKFISQKSYMEYKLCSSASVMNLQDYLLKIRIRPDMSVVLQLVPLTPNQNSAEELGVFLLQTLQFLLQRQT